MSSFVQRTLRSAKMYFWRKLYDAGYSIRRNENNAFHDQSRLMENVKVDTIFDLGANAGEVALTYRKLFADSQVYAFEPFPSMAEGLKKRFADEKWCHVQPVAVGAQVGTESFNINNGADTSSLLETDLQHVPEAYQSLQRTDQVIQVPIETIDHFCLEHGIESIDVLKMDIQGGELSALKGAARMLQTKKIQIIYTEAFLLPFYKNQPLLGDIASYLASHGYLLHNLYNIGFSGTTGRCTWFDAIFVSPKLQCRSRELLVDDLRV